MNLLSWVQASMSSAGYFNIIKVAILTFPLLAFLMTLPYMLHQYHKYGSVYYLRAGIFYSFVLYLLVAYFLVILPLPTISSVEKLTTPRVQLVPFHFIIDFFNNSPLILNNPKTYLSALMHPSSYIVLYNILLTVPFGVYLCYYFKKDWKQTTFQAFLLSLFFELTQLSGLYFIYPRGYRLFDVDDLILNTLGGLIGYALGKLLTKFLPSRDKIEEDSYRLGQRVSFLKRMMMHTMDFILFMIFSILIIPKVKYFGVCFLIYFVILPLLFKGKTLGGMFFHLKIVTEDEENIKFLRLLSREVLAIFIYICAPMIMLWALFNSGTSSVIIYLLCMCSAFIIIILLYLLSLVRLIRHRPLFHEVITKTKYISTIKVPIDEKSDKIDIPNEEEIN